MLQAFRFCNSSMLIPTTPALYHLLNLAALQWTEVCKSIAMEGNRFFLRLISLLVASLFLGRCTSNTVNGAVDGGVVAPESDHKAPCPSYWVIDPSKSKCFRYMAEFMSWDQSESYCRGYDGHLAALETTQELSFAQKVCNGSINGCWVGGRSINSTVVGWKWSDNTSLWNESIFPSLSFPSNCTKTSCHISNSCTLVSNGNNSLMTEKCNASHAFICMVNIGMTITSDIVLHCCLPGS